MPHRPSLDGDLPGVELRRWYWTRAELVGLARQLGVSAGGGKIELTDRLVAALDGLPPPPPAARRPAAAGALPEPLTARTVLPAGQRCTEQLRRFLRSEVGPAFRFDAAMRAFVADGAGRTIGEMIERWHSSRADGTSTQIAPQFELNRFLRQWRAANPGRTHAEALTAWRAHRDLPRDPPPAAAGATGPPTGRPRSSPGRCTG